MTSPTLYTPGGLPVPGLAKEPNIPLDMAALGEALDPMVELRFDSTTERDGTWPATVAPLGARCFVTGTGKRYMRWATTTAPKWFELRGASLVVANVAERDTLTPVVTGLLTYDSSTKRVSEYGGAAWVDLNPRVTVRRSTAQAASGSLTTSISFDSTSARSTPGMWSAANPTRLLVPETGEYDLSIAVTWNISPNPGALVVGYTVNGGGATWIDLRASQSYFSAWQATTLRGIDLAVGSYLEVIGLQNSDPSRQLVAGSTATLELVRR